MTRRYAPIIGALATAVLLASCATAPSAEESVEAMPLPSSPSACVAVDGAGLAPDAGVLAGVNLDWANQTLAEYTESLGRRPSVAVSFSSFPLNATDTRNIQAAHAQVRDNGGMLLLTLEPRGGLDTATEKTTDGLARMLDRFNREGVPVIVRFAHEMNGSWYEWGQQPAAYKAAFRRMADSIHRLAPGSATMWAPNYGGGYPFTGGRHEARPGTADFAALDTDRDGTLTGADDPYAPYYPGDDAVDWVGMSLYHWGNTYPWGANVVPESGKFAEQLTGNYNGAGGNDLAVPDFYAEYGQERDKPVAIPETAALVASGGAGAEELAIKRAWWGQLFDPALHNDYPALKMVNWFEWDKHEVEVDGTVDWRAGASPLLAEKYAADLPGWYRFAAEPAPCTPAY